MCSHNSFVPSHAHSSHTRRHNDSERITDVGEQGICKSGVMKLNSVFREETDALCHKYFSCDDMTGTVTCDRAITVMTETDFPAKYGLNIEV